MADVLFTGFPGFLGSALLPLALARRPQDSALCLVQEAHLREAEERLAELALEHPELPQRVRLVVGDITVPGLGLAPDDLADVREVFHLAAVYDLAVPEDVAHRVNCRGTDHVLEVCRSLPELRRLQYVSTCYVSGSHEGHFAEEDLDTDQQFGNHYESTKFTAEAQVRDAMAAGLPATIYRPGIVVGDSLTGETQKFDGPYFVIRFLLRQPTSHVIVPRVADPDRIRFSLVPRDFVVEAIDALSVLPEAVGQTYALTDPSPPTVRELVDTFCELLGKKPTYVPVPLPVAEAAMAIPGMERVLGFPAEALPYFAHPTVYGTSRATEHLAAAGLRCPSFRDYAATMVEYVREHPDVSSDAMV